MQCVCGSAQAGGWVGAAASLRVLTEQLLQVKTKVYKGLAACRYYFLKSTQTRQCRASCGQHFKADWQNFGAGKILPDLSF
jgi:hypothetical protein